MDDDREKDKEEDKEDNQDEDKEVGKGQSYSWLMKPKIPANYLCGGMAILLFLMFCFRQRIQLYSHIYEMANYFPFLRILKLVFRIC